MGYNTKTLMPCSECGESTTHRQAKTRLPLCIACSGEIMEANIHNLQSHRGPYHDKWAAGVAKFLSRQGWTGGVPPTMPETASGDAASG